MKNKLFFLIAVFVLLFGLIFIISSNRNAREKVKLENKRQLERQQFVHDSLQNIQENMERIRAAKLSEANTNFRTINPNAPSEDFSSYINSSLINSGDTDIAVTILDETGYISSSFSSSIANIYTQNGINGKAGLIRSSFIGKNAFQELMEGNSEIILKLKLSNHTDYLAIGSIHYSQKNGTLVDGTFVCTISMTMNIISVNQKSIVKSFSCSANGNGATEDQAKEHAIDKLLNKYKSDYSSI